MAHAYGHRRSPPAASEQELRRPWGAAGQVTGGRTHLTIVRPVLDSWREAWECNLVGGIRLPRKIWRRARGARARTPTVAIQLNSQRSIVSTTVISFLPASRFLTCDQETGGIMEAQPAGFSSQIRDQETGDFSLLRAAVPIYNHSQKSGKPPMTFTLSRSPSAQRSQPRTQVSLTKAHMLTRIVCRRTHPL
eukprot:4601521-Prymnesium_polylepis.1